MQTPIMSAKQILDGPSLLQKIRRISFQIYENNFEEKEIIIAGVIGEGFALAKMLCAHIQEISKLQAKAVEIHLNKEIPYEKPVRFDCSLDLFENKVIDSSASSFVPQGVRPEGLIQIQAANLEAAKKGVKFLTSLPEELKSSLTVVKVRSTGALVLISQNNGKLIEIRWGSDSENELKLKVYKALIALPENADIKRVDVSAPLAPIVK